MDYSDMVESLKKQQQLERSQPGYYDGCTKIDWEFDAVCQEMDKNAVVVEFQGQQLHRPSRPQGQVPRIAEFVDIAKSMTQGSGRVVSLCQ